MKSAEGCSGFMAGIKKAVVITLEFVCVTVDAIPAVWVEAGRIQFSWRGQWGHRFSFFQPANWSASLDGRWDTGVWKDVVV